jgi:hypothetical protein
VGRTRVEEAKPMLQKAASLNTIEYDTVTGGELVEFDEYEVKIALK